MYLVFDTDGGFVEVEKYVDVKELIASGHYTRFFDKSNPQNSKDPKFINHVNNLKVKHHLQNNPKLIHFESPVFQNIECRTSRDIKTNSRFVTIISTAEIVRDDIKKFGVHGDVIVINDAGFYYPKFNHHVSHHGDILDMVKRYRNKFRSTFKNDYCTHTTLHTDVGFSEKEQSVADFIWKFRPKATSSGMLGVFVAISLGYRAIMVHGMPLRRMNHFFDLTDTHVGHQFIKFYKRVTRPGILHILRSHNVRFSSGRMTTFIEQPTTDWIEENV